MFDPLTTALLPIPRMESFDTDEGRGSLIGVGEGGRLEKIEGN